MPAEFKRKSKEPAASRPGKKVKKPTYKARMTTMELKNLDATPQVPNTVATTTGTVNLLNGSVVGAQPTNRVGRRFTMKSILVRGYVQLGTATTGSSSVRCILVYDKQTNKAAPAATDILNTDDIRSQNLLANSRRFKILRDIICPVLGTAGPQTVYINEYLKCNLDVECIDGAGSNTVADITSGGLFLLTYATAGMAGTNITSALVSRVRFSDS